jgi:hypothetical protein
MEKHQGHTTTENIDVPFSGKLQSEAEFVPVN